MFIYTSSRGKRNRRHSKSEFQMFSLISGRHQWCPLEGHQYGAGILRSINLREKFRQIAKEQCTAQTLDLEKLFID